eukprot:251090-Pyramimonas_sp.AAC.1
MGSIMRSIVGSTGVPWCPVVSRGAPLNAIDSKIVSEIDREIDVVSRGFPWVSRGVRWCPVE